MQTRTEQPPWPDKAWQGPRPANPGARTPGDGTGNSPLRSRPLGSAAPQQALYHSAAVRTVPPSPPPFRDPLDTTLRRRAWRWSEWSTTSATLGPTLGEGSCLLRRLAAPEFSCPPGVTTRDRARRQRCPSPPGRSRPSFTTPQIAIPFVTMFGGFAPPQQSPEEIRAMEAEATFTVQQVVATAFMLYLSPFAIDMASRIL
ncbi:hypothetical protein PCL_02443 [Purpureocillium lilacinum]|uniref:Uncharacterized protein n=3 Tax=Purpureocillium TaxID=1052105 RepID=A0A2U3E0N3_PURLI|nr:hypothetical protein PCL_02443 [Purpureocillium lilacinum]